MRRIKLLALAMILALAAMIIAQPPAVQAAEELGQSIVFVQVPEEWETPRIWAWGPRGNASPIDWPGNLYLMPDPGNPGWHFIWLPNDKTGGLINEAGGEQTSDFPLTGEPVWVTINGAGDDFEVTTEPQTTGAFPGATTVIFAQIPAEWETPRVWAWGPRGNASPTDWPGNLYMMPVPGNEGWYFFHVDADKTGALINEAGGAQTSDFPLAGQPVWVSIYDADGSFEATNEALTTGGIPQMYTLIYAQIPAGWETPRVWAWGPRGNASPIDWPGNLYMTADPANPGWYYIYLPVDKTGALINEAGGAQTSDFPMTGENVWVTIADDGEFEVTNAQQTEGGFPPFIPLPVAAADDGEMIVVDANIVYVQVPADWGTPGFWGWGGYWFQFYDGAWPGPLMNADPDNPGWYYLFIPANVTGLVINYGYVPDEGGAQTSDFSLDGSPLWIMVSDELDDEGHNIATATNEQQTEGAVRTRDAFAFGVPEEVVFTDGITVRAFVPAEWEHPGVWAWDDEQGYGNVFGGWPGQAFTERDGDWYTMILPDWINHIIINCHATGQQTDDIEVTVGNDLWIVVLNEFGIYSLSYEEVDPHEAEAAPRPDPVDFGPAPTQAPATTTPAPAADDDNGLPMAAIIGIIAGVVVLLGAGAFLLLKKKK
ncbi:MAG: starch-binding protein [Defluviitaleaceae bacterium]|nr:starch-binding protein [Defluviitaleaceae bacterium]